MKAYQSIKRENGKVVNKKWGYEVWLQKDGGRKIGYCGKILYFYPNSNGSMHKHPMKTETLYVVEGEGELIQPTDYLEGAKAEIAFTSLALEEGDIFHIPSGSWHSFKTNASPLMLMEVSTPHEDDDVVRFYESKGPGED